MIRLMPYELADIITLIRLPPSAYAGASYGHYTALVIDRATVIG